MTFEEWCVFVYEKTCDRFWKKRKRIPESGYYFDGDPHVFNRIYEAVVAEYPSGRMVTR